MRQTRRPRTSNEERRRRDLVVAVTMLLLALGAGVLVSAGSAHHQPDTAETVPASVVLHDDAAATNPLSAHRHHRGNDWAPTLSKRLRPVANVAILGVVPARPVTTGVHDDESPSAVPPATDDGLALLGVLRI